MSSNLYVGNLPFEASGVELRSLFEQAGTVESVRIITDRYTGRPRGFAFVEMATEAEAGGGTSPKLHLPRRGDCLIALLSRKGNALRGRALPGRAFGVLVRPRRAISSFSALRSLPSWTCEPSSGLPS
jgi:hypothetical protein